MVSGRKRACERETYRGNFFTLHECLPRARMHTYETRGRKRSDSLTAARQAASPAFGDRRLSSSRSFALLEKCTSLVFLSEGVNSTISATPIQSRAGTPLPLQLQGEARDDDLLARGNRSTDRNRSGGCRTDQQIEQIESAR